MNDDVHRLLQQNIYQRALIERFLDPADSGMWTRYDPHLGYLMRNCIMQDGVDSSNTISHYEPAGQRLTINFKDEPCQINTYGNSFTQCEQVSDGETWQEYLAAHLGEPIRNFGVSGYGAYQAYLRARQVEETPLSTEYVIFNIWDDDHLRSLDASRWVRADPNEYKFGQKECVGENLHGTPWDHLRIDLDMGKFVEIPTLAPTPDALRALCEPDRFFKTFQDDPIIKLWVLEQGGCVYELDDLQAIAEFFGVDVDLRNPRRASADAKLLRTTYGLRSTEYVLDQMRPWIDSRGKKLMVLLSYSTRTVPLAIQGQTRFDQTFLDYLEREKILYVDMLKKHVEDYAAFRLTPQEYLVRYYIGHYNPQGNHFFAFAIKDDVVAWLEPKPLAYRVGVESFCHQSITGG